MKKKGFTLIELLAVIVILAVIALIAIPQILSIIYKTKLAAAEDSTLGIAEATNNYIGNFVVRNDASLPSGGLTFMCNGECTLDTSNISDDYDLKNLMQLEFSGIRPTGGIVTVSSDGKSIIIDDLLIDDFVCNYPVDGKASCVNKDEVDKNKPLTIPTGEPIEKGWSQSKTVKLTYSGSGTYLFRPGVNVTANISVIPCSYVNDGTSTCNGEAIAAGSTITGGSNKWYKVTSNPTLTFTGSGSVAIKVTNGVSYKDGSAVTVDKIDRTAPTKAEIKSTSVTTNSITVNAGGTDEQSGISRYQFSKDGGTTWTSAQTSNKYTYSGLENGSYNIKVRVINGTFVNNGQNSLNTTESEIKAVTTGSLTVPTGEAIEKGWSQSKNVEITYTGNGAYLFRPSVNVTANTTVIPCSYVNNGAFTCNGGAITAGNPITGGTGTDKWYKVTSNPTLTFTSSGSVAIKVADGNNYKDGSAVTVGEIDRTKPTAASFTTSVTTNSITVRAAGSDNESGIVRYQFSKDGGNNWTSAQTGNSYTFSSLSSGSYNIKVRVINGTFINNGQNNLNTTESATQAITTGTLTRPTGEPSKSGWSQSKTATLKYTGSGTYLFRPSVNVTANTTVIPCSYVNNGSFTCNGGAIAAGNPITGGTGTDKWYKVTGNTVLTFTSSGSVAIKVADGTNHIDGTAVTLSQIDRTAPTEASFNTTVATNYITVTASGKDEQSGIVRYQFSKDGGKTWVPTSTQTGNSYTFSSLSSGSYNIKVRVINGTYGINGQNSLNTKESETKSISFVCNNTTKTVSCSKTCGNGSVSGTRVDTYNCNNQLVSTGTCNATCPAAPKVTNFTVTAGDVLNYNTTNVTLGVTVTSGANISKYEFYNGNTLLATTTTISKSTTKVINSLPTSAMNFRVVVYDQYGQTGSSNITESCNIDSSYMNGRDKYNIYKCTTGRQYNVFIKTCSNTEESCRQAAKNTADSANCAAACSHAPNTSCYGDCWNGNYNSYYNNCIQHLCD